MLWLTDKVGSVASMERRRQRFGEHVGAVEGRGHERETDATESDGLADVVNSHAQVPGLAIGRRSVVLQEAHCDLAVSEDDGRTVLRESYFIPKILSEDAGDHPAAQGKELAS